MFSINKDTCPVCCLLNRLLEAARKYTILDYAMFKTCIFSFGALCGVLIAKAKDGVKSTILLVLSITFICTYFYIMLRTFFHMSKEN